MDDEVKLKLTWFLLHILQRLCRYCIYPKHLAISCKTVCCRKLIQGMGLAWEVKECNVMR